MLLKGGVVVWRFVAAFCEGCGWEGEWIEIEVLVVWEEGKRGMVMVLASKNF